MEKARKTKANILAAMLTAALILVMMPQSAINVFAKQVDPPPLANDTKYPSWPANATQKHYIIFSEGFRSGRTEMSIFDTSINDPSTYIVWNKNLTLNNQNEFQNCDQYYMDNGVWTKFITDYHVMSDWALSIYMLQASRTVVKKTVKVSMNRRNRCHEER